MYRFAGGTNGDGTREDEDQHELPSDWELWELNLRNFPKIREQTGS